MLQEEAPLEMAIEEEVEIGSEIGILEAVDLDVGENAQIGYLITCKNLFSYFF